MTPAHAIDAPDLSTRVAQEAAVAAIGLVALVLIPAIVVWAA